MYVYRFVEKETTDPRPYCEIKLSRSVDPPATDILTGHLDVIISSYDLFNSLCIPGDAF